MHQFCSLLITGERCKKYTKDGEPACRVPKQRGGDPFFDAIPVNQLFNDDTRDLIRSKTGEKIIKKNPYKDNEAIGNGAPSKDEYIMHEDFEGSLIFNHEIGHKQMFCNRGLGISAKKCLIL